MLDRTQLKVQGIRFGRSLLMVFKTINMFSAEHNAAIGPMQQSYDLLNFLVKEAGQFTIGFVDQRIMLNNILTTERNLAPLETEFLKRGFGAITFQPGLTHAGYKRAIAVVARSPKVIEEFGGIAKYLHENPIDSVRVFPASKNAIRNESGDTILETDSESFLMAKAISEMRPTGGVMDNLERMLQTSGLCGDPLAAPGFSGGTLQSSGLVAALGAGGSAAAMPQRTAAVSGPQGILGMVENYFDTTVMDSEAAPQRSYIELAKVLQEMRPEMVLSAFPPKRREELRQLPPEQMAVEVIEDSAVKWAVGRLTTVPSGADAVIVEEEVVRVLLRSLQATQMADRLARKLAQYVKDLNIPESTTTRIQEELRWVVVPEKKKTEELLKLERFDQPQFRRLIEHLKELLKLNDDLPAIRLAVHFCDFLNDAAGETKLEDFGRLPEIMRVMGMVRGAFWQKLADKLCAALSNEGHNQFVHVQVINSLTTLAKTVSVYEEFGVIQKIGARLEDRAATDLQHHTICCLTALQNLLTPNAIERIIEIYIQKRDDGGWTKFAATLLRWAGPPAIDKLFQHLEEEQVATNRIALIRLISRIGPSALDVARTRIRHERWYVVRNTCKLLGELKDPDLLNHIAPALRHRDQRVQMAAIATIVESRLPQRGHVLADALPYVHPHIRDQILRELQFLKDVNTVPALERFIFGENHGNTPALSQAVQTLGAVPGAEAESSLYQVLIDNTLGMSVRKIAYESLCKVKTISAARRIAEFSQYSDNDPLADEVKRSFTWSQAL